MTLEVRAFSYQIDDELILKDLTFTVESGAIAGFFGESGCGKSTLFKALSGIEWSEYNQATGKILYDGQDISAFSPLRRTQKVSLLFQNPDVQFCMDTVENELLFCLRNKQTPVEKMATEMDKALSFCEIKSLKFRKLSSLSGGEKQRVALACSFIFNSDVLLLDEPFANLDEQSTQLLLGKLFELNQLHGTTLLFIDHDVSPYQKMIEKWYVIEEGKLKEQTTTIELLNSEKKACSDKKPVILLEKVEQKSDEIRFEAFSLAVGKQMLIRDFSQVLSTGKIIGLSGKSGSGKSSILRALVNDLDYKGQIIFQNQNLKRQRKKKIFKRMSFIFQNPQDQFIESTVWREISLGLKETQDNKVKIESILKRLSLFEKRNLSPFLLSQGEQRRLAVGELLLRKVDLLLCDEPTYGQDFKNAIFIMDLIQEKVVKEGVTALIVSHDLNLLDQYCEVRYYLNASQKSLMEVKSFAKT